DPGPGDRGLGRKTGTRCRAAGRPFVGQEMTLDVSTLNVTLVFVALCTVVPFVLTSWIGIRRGKVGVLRGHGEDAELFWRSRIHGNFTENAPTVALVIFVAEASGISDGWLWAAVAAFLAGRIYHALRFDHKDRAVGMKLSTAPAVALCIATLIAS
ncbi:MAG: MAPEG family protein, partial [Nannocystaceae bacterium]|nr:MAPEG family protein [Nannocystaceae bacterium]